MAAVICNYSFLPYQFYYYSPKYQDTIHLIWPGRPIFIHSLVCNLQLQLVESLTSHNGEKLQTVSREVYGLYV